MKKNITEFKIGLMLEYIQSLLDVGDRVVISRNGIDTELHEVDEPAECLQNAHEYVAGLMEIEKERHFDRVKKRASAKVKTAVGVA